MERGAWWQGDVSCYSKILTRQNPKKLKTKSTFMILGFAGTPKHSKTIKNMSNETQSQRILPPPGPSRVLGWATEIPSNASRRRPGIPGWQHAEKERFLHHGWRSWMPWIRWDDMRICSLFIYIHIYIYIHKLHMCVHISIYVYIIYIYKKNNLFIYIYIYKYKYHIINMR